MFNDTSDWGQDTYRVARWIEEHADEGPVYVQSMISGQREIESVCKREFQSLGSLTNETTTPYWVVISKSDMAIGMSAYDDYESREPDELIGATHFAYWIDSSADD